MDEGTKLSQKHVVGTASYCRSLGTYIITIIITLSPLLLLFLHALLLSAIIVIRKWDHHVYTVLGIQMTFQCTVWNFFKLTLLTVGHSHLRICVDAYVCVCVSIKMIGWCWR